MARELTTAFKVGITAGTVRPVILTVAEFDSATLRFWNGAGPFEYNGDTYTGAGNLLKVAEVVETQSIEARGTSFELSGIPSSLLATALGEDYQDRSITQTFVALDSGGAVILDPFQFFSGKADVMAIEDSGKFSTIKLSAESDLIILGRVNERRRTKEDQRLEYEGDTFYDHVTSLLSKDIVWGKNG